MKRRRVVWWGKGQGKRVKGNGDNVTGGTNIGR